MKRRERLKNLRALPLIERIASAGIPPQSVMTATKVAKCNLFAELGLRAFINATGNHVIMAGVLTGISWNTGKVIRVLKWARNCDLVILLYFIKVISWESEDSFKFTIFMLQAGEEKFVAGLI